MNKRRLQKLADLHPEQPHYVEDWPFSAVKKVTCLRCGYMWCTCPAMTICATLDRIEARQGRRVRTFIEESYE